MIVIFLLLKLKKRVPLFLMIWTKRVLGIFTSKKSSSKKHAKIKDEFISPILIYITKIRKIIPIFNYPYCIDKNSLWLFLCYSSKISLKPLSRNHQSPSTMDQSSSEAKTIYSRPVTRALEGYRHEVNRPLL